MKHYNRIKDKDVRTSLESLYYQSQTYRGVSTHANGNISQILRFYIDEDIDGFTYEELKNLSPEDFEPIYRAIETGLEKRIFMI